MFSVRFNLFDKAATINRIVTTHAKEAKIDIKCPAKIIGHMSVALGCERGISKGVMREGGKTRGYMQRTFVTDH